MGFIAWMWIGIAIISILIFLFIRYKQSNKIQNKKIVKLFNRIFNRLNKVSFLNHKLQNIKVRIYNNSLDEEWLIKYRTILYLIISWIVGITSIIFVILYFIDNLYVTFTLIFFSFQIKNMTLDYLIGDDTNFLVGIYNYSIELQQAFTLTKDVHLAISEANSNSSNYNLVKRMEEVDVLLDDAVAIEEFITECPNEYLKLLIINCNLVNEYGDKKDIDGKSVFLENIFYNNQNIETEVFKRRQLQFWLRGMALICILPLLSFSPYDAWVGSKLPMTNIFYKAESGFIVKLAITALSITCFYIIKSLENIHGRRNIKERKFFWEEVFFKVDIIKRFIKMLVPKNNSRKGYKYKLLISQSGDYTKVEYIYLRKVLLALVGFILTVCISISVKNITRNNILEDQTAEFSSKVIVVENKQEYSKELEKKLIKEVDLNNLEGTYENLKQKLIYYGVNTNVDATVKRIVEKRVALENIGLSWYDILISIIVVVILYNVPEAVLKMKAKMRRYEMQNEVIIFETIILIFMYHENATSELILEYMSKFADIFKVQVDEVLKEIRKSDMEALEMYIQEIKYKPFLSLIRNIIKAENIRVQDAFISLADNRRNYLMNRKEENRRLVYKSVSKSRLISMIPINLVIIAYISVPMLYVAFVQLDNSQNELMELQTEQHDNMEYNISD